VLGHRLAARLFNAMLDDELVHLRHGQQLARKGTSAASLEPTCTDY
jgi:hypothetical protein